MSDETDLDLYQAPGSALEPDPPIPPPSEPPSPWPVIIGVILIIGAAAGFFFFRSHRPEPPAVPTTVAAPGVTAPPATTAGRQDEGPVPVLPPLDESDPAVRDLMAALSRDPLVAAWLGGDQLVRGLAKVGVSIADGQSPASLLRRLAPGTAFSVRSEGGRTVIDAASYHRYDSVAAAVDSIEPAAAARAYRALRPRLEDAYKELGMDGTIDAVVARAASQVLAAPVVNGPVVVVPSGIVHVYADPALEDLPPLAKLLVRMGPDNVRRIQARVRAILPDLHLQAGTH